ncbi:MAG: glucose-1-phosphate thymidylyltransferase [Candidatus Magasanikbacteria bacterium RIFOXYD2_FULL_39_9]|nr:MAG: glucose-1-phosphate thymidylyltransferase [Candidatus Magasanikbacteria bacterium RIFOXYD2_FULL_39_9]
MQITKAILTGGGRATRLRPVTSTMNKHLIPLANKPMIFHVIEKAVEAGVEEIFINTNPGETELQKYIGDGGHWGVKITFFEQEGGPQGVAHVVKQAEKFIGNDPFLFFLSDNVILGSLKGFVDEFVNGNYDCMLALSKVEDPERFGVPVLDANGKLTDVIEKPKNPPNNFAVTGIYLYGPNVFFKAFDHIQKSDRGEYEISSIHSDLLKNNLKVGYKEITGWWKDTGKPEDLIVANQLLMEEITAENFKVEGQIEAGAQVGDKVRIGVGTTVNKNVKIIGPALIGENCTLEDCIIGPNATIGTGSTIKQAQIKNSIILSKCRIVGEIKLSDSIVGSGVTVAKSQSDYQKMILGENTLVEL